jgi:hypothetical protein
MQCDVTSRSAILYDMMLYDCVIHHITHYDMACIIHLCRECSSASVYDVCCINRAEFNSNMSLFSSILTYLKKSRSFYSALVSVWCNLFVCLCV